MLINETKKIIRLSMATLAFTFLTATGVYAAGAGSTAAEFLNIGAGSRATAMGGAYSSIANDPSACYWNPAGLSNIEGSALMLQHNEHYQDLQHEYVAYASPIVKNGVLGISVSYLHMGAIMGYDDGDTPTESFKVYDIAYGMSYGHRFSDYLSIGVGAKNIRQSISDVKAGGWAFDMGLMVDIGQFDLSVGVANLGSGIKYEVETFDLPTEYRAGLGFSPITKPFTLVAEYGYCIDGSERLALGVEYDIINDFSIRSGYRPREINNGDGRFAVGCGLKIWGQRIDYSFLPDSDLGSSHRFSATIAFSEFSK